ncbi:unnamed protein product [Aureobasidium mustum]|uniref:F-box domain-containing protein n=1 Tax=Aureobasidium mustum TaxID=2773714 RepID=A0A9N8K389_9PEZI|nr:unnamed protein product [Aureobasidium mustum]
MASASTPPLHPAEFAPHPTQLRNPKLYTIDEHPLLKPEILAVVFSFLAEKSNDTDNNDDDNGDSDGNDNDRNIWSLAQATEVCRQWWEEGHHLLWRKIQVRDLLFYVRDPARRSYYASLVEELVFEPDDHVLSTTRMANASLSFPRLQSVRLNETNILNVRHENLSSLLTSTLRLLSFHGDAEVYHPTRDRDDQVLFNSLLARCGSLVTLKFDTWCHDSKWPTNLSIVERSTSIEHLTLGYVLERIMANHPPDDTLHKLFNKPRLVSLSFPQGVDVSQTAVDTLLATMGRKWLLPSLRLLRKPGFDCGMAAARLIGCLPNLVDLSFSITRWDIDLEYAFIAVGMLENLQTLDMDINIYNGDLDGSWLIHLAGLKHLKWLWLEFDEPGTISLTGTQLAYFLTGLPKLEILSLAFGSPVVSCLPVEKTTIERAIARIATVNIEDMTFVTQEAP